MKTKTKLRNEIALIEARSNIFFLDPSKKQDTYLINEK